MSHLEGRHAYNGNNSRAKNIPDIRINSQVWTILYCQRHRTIFNHLVDEHHPSWILQGAQCFCCTKTALARTSAGWVKGCVMGHHPQKQKCIVFIIYILYLYIYIYLFYAESVWTHNPIFILLLWRSKVFNSSLCYSTTAQLTLVLCNRLVIQVVISPQQRHTHWVVSNVKGSQNHLWT